MDWQGARDPGTIIDSRFIGSARGGHLVSRQLSGAHEDRKLRVKWSDDERQTAFQTKAIGHEE